MKAPALTFRQSLLSLVKTAEKSRLEKAKKIAQEGLILDLDVDLLRGVITAKVQGQGTAEYNVKVRPMTSSHRCDCLDFQRQGGMACKHIIAVCGRTYKTLS